MPTLGDSFTSPLLIIASFLMAIAAISIHLLPNGIASLVAAWVIMSVPVGIAMGHCVLSEE